MTLPSIAGVQSRIHTLPGRAPFMLADDLAEFYQTTPSNLMRQVRRNIGRFPEGFIFELTEEEYREKSCQNGTTSQGKRADLTHYGFTEMGALQLSSVLGGPVADAVSVIIIRAFVSLRDGTVDGLRRAAFKLEAAYMGRSAMKLAIKRAAEEGMTFDQLWGWHDWSAFKLGVTIEEMRALGYIPQSALRVPPYVFTNARRAREMENLKAHAEDARQMTLFGEA